MKASEYKKLKGLRKESLRDNMTDIEVALTNKGKWIIWKIKKKSCQVQTLTGVSAFKKTLTQNIENTDFLKNRLLHI